MGFALPLEGTKARELMGDVATIAEILAPQNVGKLLVIWQARKAALAMFEADKTGAMKRVAMVVIRANNDERWLVTFGRRGGWKKEWNFGTGRPAQ